MDHAGGGSDTCALPVRIELGRGKLRAAELRQFDLGSLVTLDCQTDEPVDVYVDGRLVARGEIVVVDNRFCVRVTERVSHVNTIA